LAEVSRNDFARRYGAFLGFLRWSCRLESHAGAADQVTSANVEAYIAELKVRVRSVTVWNSIYKLRRAAQLLAPKTDFSWLAEIEKDLALEMEPRSKFGRLVLTGRLVEAGLTLVAEAQEFASTDLARARGVRNGLMVALLALCPIRLKNFADLEIGHTFKEVDGSWWIALPSHLTKSRRPDERRVPALLNRFIELYLSQSRPLLLKSSPPTNVLWISSTTGRPLTTKNLGTLISKITLETIGVDVSPHLFRTAAASTAAAYGGNTPHLASAVLNHIDPRVTEEHYNRASSVSAATAYASIISGFRTR
jgi:integrase